MEPSYGLGKVQQMIIRDAEGKRYFGPQDLTKYYPNQKKAVAEFEKLLNLGFFDKGKDKKSGDIVFISKVYKPTLKDMEKPLPEMKTSKGMFECPEWEALFDVGWKLTDIQTCESSASGEGCMYIPTCPAYKKQKKEKGNE